VPYSYWSLGGVLISLRLHSQLITLVPNLYCWCTGTIYRVAQIKLRHWNLVINYIWVAITTTDSVVNWTAIRTVRRQQIWRVSRSRRYTYCCWFSWLRTCSKCDAWFAARLVCIGGLTAARRYNSGLQWPKVPRRTNVKPATVKCRQWQMCTDSYSIFRRDSPGGGRCGGVCAIFTVLVRCMRLV